jgi:hypothetical protein
VRDILHCQHHQLIAILPDSLQVRSTEPLLVLIWAIILASLFDARSRKDFFGGGGRIESLPLLVSIFLAIAQCWEISS